jgi:DNA-binding beta-propeller fold protein YncE
MVHNPAGNELYAFCYNKDVVAVIGPDREVSGFIEGLPYQSDANAILNPVLNRLYVGDDSTLWVVDCNTKQVISTHELPYYDEMAFVLLADRGRLYVFPRNTSDTLGYAVWVYDCWADEMVARIDLLAAAPDAVYHPASDLIYFCVKDTPSVRVLDPQTNTVVQTINAGRANRRDRLAVDLDRDRVYHACYRDDRLIVIDAMSATVLDSVDLERDVSMLVMNHEQDKLYMMRFSSTSGRFYIYDCLGDSLLPEKDYDPDYVALLNPRNDKLYFEGDNGLRVIDCRNDSLVGDWPEGRGVRYMAWNAIDNLVYASRRSSDIYVFADDPTGVEEMANAEVRMPNATIVRGMLPMTGRNPATLLDITGRRVLDLLPGENDVSSLSPGVYFVFRASGAGRKASSVHKVVIQR